MLRSCCMSLRQNIRSASEMTAIYARQSVERSDSISIEQQTEMCRYEARGEECRVYADRGYSGKNMNRPQFSQMMKDIGNGLIDTVVVYRLDRISRSIVDFSNMMTVFGNHGVKFISATEKFDTSSPIGNAMLNICIVFAQLERETIQKRVADAYFSRSRKGFFMGGPVPYGFRRVPVMIDGVNTSMFEPDEEEAKAVRLIFGMYAEYKTAYGDIVRKLVDLGIQIRGRKWERSRIREMILNPLYVRADKAVLELFRSEGAAVEENENGFSGVNGCYCYKEGTVRKRKGNSFEGCHIVPAPGEGIVDSALWLKCRKKCIADKKASPVRKARNSWLCGKIKCLCCGYALVVKRGGGRDIRYLMCSERLRNGECSAETIYADEAEEAVCSEMKRKASALGTDLSAVWKNMSFDEKRQLTDMLAETIYACKGRIVIRWRA